jgi:hypothetical protein
MQDEVALEVAPVEDADIVDETTLVMLESVETLLKETVLEDPMLEIPVLEVMSLPDIVDEVETKLEEPDVDD